MLFLDFNVYVCVYMLFCYSIYSAFQIPQAGISWTCASLCPSAVLVVSYNNNNKKKGNGKNVFHNINFFKQHFLFWTSCMVFIKIWSHLTAHPLCCIFYVLFLFWTQAELRTGWWWSGEKLNSVIFWGPLYQGIKMK